MGARLSVLTALSSVISVSRFSILDTPAAAPYFDALFK
jgi:hypothetical protein